MNVLAIVSLTAALFLLLTLCISLAIVSKRAGEKEEEYWRKHNDKIYDTTKPGDKEK